MNGIAQHMAEEAVTMAELFSGGGYATGIFGKWHLGDRHPLRPMDRGFGESVVFPDGAVSTVPDYWGNDYFDDVYVHNGTPRKYEGYCTDVWFDLALEFIEKNRATPFLCYLPTNAAHAPYIAPEACVAPYQGRVPKHVAAFYGMIANLDENVGRLRKRLEELGVADDTILIFTTDNGTAAGGFNAGMRGTKGSPYDGGHRVPCFIHHPAGGLTGGRDVATLAAHIDILPTLLDLCRIDCPEPKPPFDGTSLARLLAGTSDQPGDRVLVESYARIAMTPRWRLVNRRELYDITKDRAQSNDVAADFPEVVADLARALEDRVATEDHRPHHVVIGSDRQNPVTLTGEDWQERPLIYQYWIGVMPKEPARAALPRHDPRNFWPVKVAEAGRYRLTLRRWPRETDTAIRAALAKDQWCHVMSRCDPLAATEARLRVQDQERAMPVADGMTGADFTIDLAAGSTTVEGWFVDDDHQPWSACFVDVERLTKPQGK